ncbi:olfactory receptor 52K1-like [Pseudophryne corroboree]|uniref:olfactory receptor 52K1-like n=1 Tax=Pseudophryne corroboree TaxID=495146 RepID=UPI0030820E46
MEKSNLNKTSPSHTVFILLGFPGVTRYRPLLVIPFSSIYAAILAGNSVVMSIIVLEKSLHSPMYILIFSLLAVNIPYTTAMIPKAILALLGLNQITLSGCLVQIFTVYSSLLAESALLLVMAVDRYLAISQPLQYWQIINKHFLAHFLFNAFLRAGVVVVPLFALLSSLQYCRSNIIYHFHCENTMLFELGCGDIAKTKIIALVVRTGLSLCDISIILISYLKVLHTVMKITVGAARHKALNTCSTHLLVVALMYVSGIISVILNLPDAFSSYNVQNICSAVYYLLPAVINPFIYGLWMSEIKDKLLKHWRRRNLSLKQVTDRNK